MEPKKLTVSHSYPETPSVGGLFPQTPLSNLFLPTSGFLLFQAVALATVIKAPPSRSGEGAI